ncbi:uncharacterized protein KY384_004937 [Bacidia gigantensis]|uniref:uncharacterized protein n=1 Tax=Bacidia gigantensis TaxID=2732470 RepID=UPI001D054D66|nr:uncharacterized protein KY384_004937 [Bacidia gigantensis]KAG8530435.1 hypothetical protein KY384_004937 [Bacidia gigantensis]
MAVKYKLPPIDDILTLSSPEQAAILDSLFEPSPLLHELCLPSLGRYKFSNYDELIAFVGRLLNDLFESGKTTQLDEVLVSHPRLGATSVQSSQSQGEQSQLQSSDSRESEKLTQMNAIYEHNFPGLRYVTFVDGRQRGALLEDMQRRVDRFDINAERSDALRAICDIASDRARKLSN